MGFVNAVKDMIGIADDDDELEITQKEIEREKKRISDQEEPMSRVSPITPTPKVTPPADHNYGFEKIEPVFSRAPQSRERSINSSQPFNMVVIEPKSYEECTKLIDNLKARKPIVVNLGTVEPEQGRKMFDFLGGATYALNGNMLRIAPNIFIFAPENVNIAAKVNRETMADVARENGSSSPWDK